MAPTPKIKREMIIDASFTIIKELGYEQLNTRMIAKYLHCSTQPIMYHFKTIEDLKKEVYQVVDEYHSMYIMPKGKDMNPLLELGLNYIRFGYEEKNLFRFLFQTNTFSGETMMSLVSNPDALPLIQIVSSQMEYSQEQAKHLFFQLFVTVHGIASLLANNAMDYEENLFKETLMSMFRG